MHQKDEVRVSYSALVVGCSQTESRIIKFNKPIRDKSFDV